MATWLARCQCCLQSPHVTAPRAASAAGMGMHRTHSSESLGQTAAQAIMTQLAGQQQGKGQGGGTPPVMNRSASGSLLGPAGAPSTIPASHHVDDSRQSFCMCFYIQWQQCALLLLLQGREVVPQRTPPACQPAALCCPCPARGPACPSCRSECCPHPSQSGCQR